MFIKAREIDQIANNCILEGLKKLSDNCTDKEVDFFYACLSNQVALYFHRYTYEELKKD